MHSAQGICASYKGHGRPAATHSHADLQAIDLGHRIIPKGMGSTCATTPHLEAGGVVITLDRGLTGIGNIGFLGHSMIPYAGH
jgi:hypothetical protein